MIKLTRLADGRYKLTFKYKNKNVEIDKVWYFEEADMSDATEEKILFSFSVHEQ